MTLRSLYVCSSTVVARDESLCYARTMESVVLTDDVLFKILDWLPLQSKFLATRVSRQWRRVCMQLLRGQRCLVISSPDALNMKIRVCVANDLRHQFTRSEVLLVSGSLQMLRMMSAVFTHCPKVTAVCIPSVFRIRNYELANSLMISILERYGSQLQCLNCYEFPEESKVMLPALTHLSLSTTSHLEAIYEQANSLTALQINDLNYSFAFLHGLRILNFMSEPRGLEQLFVSPAAQTLEVLTYRVSCSEHLETGQFYFPNLKSILFHGGLELQVMIDFLRSLRLSNQLQELDLLSIMSSEDIPVHEWEQLFMSLSELQKLRISKPSIRSEVIPTLVHCCHRLKELSLVDCALDDRSLNQLSSLTQLEEISLTFNELSISEGGMLDLLRGSCSMQLRKLVLYKCKGSFLTDDVRQEILRLKTDGKLQVCKMSADNGAFDLTQPETPFFFTPQ